MMRIGCANNYWQSPARMIAASVEKPIMVSGMFWILRCIVAANPHC